MDRVDTLQDDKHGPLPGDDKIMKAYLKDKVKVTAVVEFTKSMHT